MLQLQQLGCSCGRVSSHLTSCFYCANCHCIRCTHPTCTSEVADVVICPTCQRRYPGPSAAQLCGRCPSCPSPADTAVLSSSQAEAFCLELSRSAQLASLLPQLPGRRPGGQAAGGAGHTVQQAQQGAAAPPPRRLGVPLLPLLTRRCKACLAAGRPGILTSPTPAGAGGAGEAKLYRKLSAAAAVLPWLTLAPVGALGAAYTPPPPPSAQASSALHQLCLAAAAAAASQPGGSATLPLLLHIANPLEHPCAFTLGQLSLTVAAAVAAPPGDQLGLGLGGLPQTWVPGYLSLGSISSSSSSSSSSPSAPQQQWVVLGPRDDLAESPPAEATAAEAAQAWSSFPWAAAPPASQQPPVTRWEQARVFGSTALCPVLLTVPGPRALLQQGGAAVEVRLSATLLLPPSAAAELQGASPSSGSSTVAVTVKYVLQL